ncbi:NAD(P)-binding protein [Hyphopichia burtonii NRRL Y-1933]|uniref:NAD(P)-binding protein n=1 Tax=Hyphopichia burtonii NRRL Y-1933 TaxID=984485 RepID=A0A1E4RLN5_9ASCO|nr:NAD(P)-binding protein [Hyphopichia burtonii NRRL Y-1933]ODV68025.1 NAD(P)-binding protein [Hyphopichia burtonii NRRL Y-1933]
MSTTYFITGANRGIGFAIVNSLAENLNNKVIATVRDKSKAVDLLKLAEQNSNIHIIEVDVGDSKSIDTLDDQIQPITSQIDIFISNAAMGTIISKVLEIPEHEWLNHYKVNTLGPILVLKKLYKYLIKSDIKKIAIISSLAGSFQAPINTNFNPYGQTKCALNFAAYNLASELKPEGFIVLAIHPGTVLTETALKTFDIFDARNPQIGGALRSMAITPEESATSVLKIINKATDEINGKFINFDGTNLAY